MPRWLDFYQNNPRLRLAKLVAGALLFGWVAARPGDDHWRVYFAICTAYCGLTAVWLIYAGRTDSPAGDRHKAEA